jgi:hypothetical protein
MYLLAPILSRFVESCRNCRRKKWKYSSQTFGNHCASLASISEPPLGALQPATHVLAYPNYDLHSSKFRQTVFTFSCNSDFYYSCVEAFSNLIPQVLKNISTFELCWLTIRGRKLDLPQAVTII